MNYNQSSYYRANPYYQEGFLPPGAFKNRKKPDFLVEIPQGREYFDPTTKKHYNQNYLQTEKIVKDPINQYSPIERDALQRSYFRSLNAKDIEGANTNTLISKAVKNKMKAQQELQRRRQKQIEEQEFKKMKDYEEEQYRSRVIEEYHKKPIEKKEKPINYHERQKTQGSNLSNSNVHSHEQYKQKPDLYQKAQRQMGYQQQKPYQEYHQNYHHNISPITNEPTYPRKQEHYKQPYPHQQERQPTRQYYPRQQHYPNRQSYPREQKHYPTRQSYENPQYNQPYHQIDKPYENYHQSYPNIEQKSHEIRKEEERKISLPHHQNYPQYREPMQKYENREDFRKHNPTFLSYGSPSFKIAGKNVIG